MQYPRIILAIMIAAIVLSVPSQTSGQSGTSFHFESIATTVDISSLRLAHVTRSARITVDAGHLDSMDWGVWYQGRTVTIAGVDDANGTLNYIYPTSESEPSHPDLRIVFARTVVEGQSYAFNYAFDVASAEDELAWSETYDVSQIRVNSLTITIMLPSGSQLTGFQPTEAKRGDSAGRTQVSWSGSNLYGQSSVGLSVGFNAATGILPTINLNNFLQYAGVIVVLASLSLYGFNRVRAMKRRKQEPELTLLSKAQKAAAEASQDLVPTGSPVLDYLLKGGLPNRSTSVLTGPVCDERDTILRRFLQTAANSGGYSVYLGKDATKIEDIVIAYPSSMRGLVAGGLQSGESIRSTARVENLTAINIDLTSILQAPQNAVSKRFCIDLLDDLLLVHKSTTSRKWLGQVLQRSKDLGYTVLATLNSQMHSQAEIQAMVDLFDGHLELIEREIEAGPKRLIRVRKMFRSKFLETEALLDRNRLSE